MKKETDKVYNEIMNIYSSSVKSLDEITLNIIKFYYSKYKSLDLELEVHTLKKPPKILKNCSKKWKDRKKELKEEKLKILKEISKEVQGLYYKN